MYKSSFFQRLLGSRSPRPEAIPRAAVRSARRAIALCQALLSERGEVSGARIAQEALAAYQALDAPSLDVFFSLLAKEFSADAAEVGRSADAYRAQASY